MLKVDLAIMRNAEILIFLKLPKIKGTPIKKKMISFERVGLDELMHTRKDGLV